MPHPVERSFIAGVRSRKLFPAGAKIVAAVSGGSDSVAMLRLMQRFSNHMAWNLSVLHIDHGTRKGCADDAEFVGDLAAELELQFVIERIEPPHEGSSPEAFFSSRRAEIYSGCAGDNRLVAVGHTASDRAETLILRLMEGAGLRGLGGMDYIGRGPVRRPLLDLTRNKLREYLGSINQAWREDPTNMKDCYLRNRIRHRIMPVFEAISPGCTQAFAASSALLTEWRDAADEITGKAIDTIIFGNSFMREDYLCFPRAVRLGILWTLAGKPRGGRKELEKTDRWLTGGSDGFHLLPGGVKLRTEGNGVWVESERGNRQWRELKE